MIKMSGTNRTNGKNKMKIENTIEGNITNIDGTEFGSITINGKKYDFDVFIFANGKIEKRSRSLSEAKHGTGHYFCFEEVQRLLESEPEEIIFGTGQDGFCKLEEEAIELLKKAKIKYQAAPTPKAIELFNRSKSKKAGLFHVTC